MDFERSEASLREDMAAKNEYFMQKYKDYTRFIGNSSDEARESEENEGGYNFYNFYILQNLLDHSKENVTSKLVNLLSKICLILQDCF